MKKQINQEHETDEKKGIVNEVERVGESPMANLISGGLTCRLRFLETKNANWQRLGLGYRTNIYI